MQSRSASSRAFLLTPKPLEVTGRRFDLLCEPSRTGSQLRYTIDHEPSRAWPFVCAYSILDHTVCIYMYSVYGATTRTRT